MNSEFMKYSITAGSKSVQARVGNGKQFAGPNSEWELFYQGWNLEYTVPPEILNNAPKDANLLTKYS